MSQDLDPENVDLKSDPPPLVFEQSVYKTLFEHLGVGAAILDASEQLVKVNPICTQMLGYSEAELCRLHLSELLHPADQLNCRTNLCCEIRYLCCEARYIRQDGSVGWANLTLSLLQSAPRQLWVLTLQEISRYKAIETAIEADCPLELQMQTHLLTLQESEARYRSVVETLSEGIVIHAANGSIIDCNASAERILGLTAAQILGHSSFDPDWRAIREDGSPFFGEIHPASITLSTGQPQHQVVMGVQRTGQPLVWIAINSQPLAGNPGGAVCSFTDITARRQVEAEMRRSRDLLAAVFQESADAIFLVDPDSLLTVDCNQRAVDLFECSSTADLIGISGASLHRYPYPADVLKAAVQSIDRWGVWTAEIEYRTFKDRFFWGSIAAKRIQLADQALTLVRVADISDRKQRDMLFQRQSERDSLLKQLAFCTRESLDLDYILSISMQQLQLYLQVDRVVIYQFQPDGSGKIVVESVSQPEFAILGQPIHDPCFNLGVAERYRLGQVSAINDITHSSLPACYIEFLAELQVAASLTVPILFSQQLWGLLIVHHFTPRPWQSFEQDLLSQVSDQIGVAIFQTSLYAQIESQLRQKEILLKEVHHRVKNNLQVISAMLKLQARSTPDAVALDLLEDSRSRLRAIALIHEILYQSDNLEQLNFDRYIQRLAQSVLATHNAQSIRLSYQLLPLLLNLETATPCGLLLSELITNAIKHAFPDERNGEIRITMEILNSSETSVEPSLTTAAAWQAHSLSHPSETQYRLTIQDNGVGIPPDLDLHQLSSLGLKIVYDLALQLRGELTLNREQGTCFQLVFSELQYLRRL